MPASEDAVTYRQFGAKAGFKGLCKGGFTKIYLLSRQAWLIRTPAVSYCYSSACRQKKLSHFRGLMYDLAHFEANAKKYVGA